MNFDIGLTQRPWGHLFLMLLFMLGTVLFLFDTLSQSRTLENTIVVLPVSILILVLCSVRLVSLVRSWPPAFDETSMSMQQQAQIQKQRDSNRKIFAYMLLLGLYVVGLSFFYFDISTFLFVFLALCLQKHRNYIFSFFYAVFLSFGTIWVLKQLVPFPVETLLI